MKNKYLHILLGVGIGAIVTFFTIEKDSVPSAKLAANKSVQKEKPQSKQPFNVVKPHIESKPHISRPKLQPKESHSIALSRSSEDSEDRVRQRKNEATNINDVRLRLRESIIASLEDNLEALQQQVYVEQSENAWRVHFIEKKNMLSSIGFHDGDLVDRENLLMYRDTDADRADLAERLDQVLANIAR